MDQPRPVCRPSYGAAGSLVLVSTTSVPCSLWERRGRRHARMSARSLLTILVISAPRSTISGSSNCCSQKQSHSVPGAECQIAPSWTFSTLGVPEGRCRRSEASAFPDQRHVPSFGDPRHRTRNRRERSLTRAKPSTLCCRKLKQARQLAQRMCAALDLGRPTGDGLVERQMPSQYL